jgi:hypothetical protein
MGSFSRKAMCNDLPRQSTSSSGHMEVAQPGTRRPPISSGAVALQGGRSAAPSQVIGFWDGAVDDGAMVKNLQGACPAGSNSLFSLPGGSCAWWQDAGRPPRRQFSLLDNDAAPPGRALFVEAGCGRPSREAFVMGRDDPPPSRQAPRHCRAMKEASRQAPPRCGTMTEGLLGGICHGLKRPIPPPGRPPGRVRNVGWTS